MLPLLSQNDHLCDCFFLCFQTMGPYGTTQKGGTFLSRFNLLGSKHYFELLSFYNCFVIIDYFNWYGNWYLKLIEFELSWMFSQLLSASSENYFRFRQIKQIQILQLNG
jgi:hypothetical protein